MAIIMRMLNNKLSSIASRRNSIISGQRFVLNSSISIISNDVIGSGSGRSHVFSRTISSGDNVGGRSHHRRIVIIGSSLLSGLFERSFSSSSTASSFSCSSSFSSSSPPPSSANTPPSDTDTDTDTVKKKTTTKTTKLTSFWPKKIIDVDATWERLQTEAYHIVLESSSSSSSFGLKQLVEQRILVHDTFIDGLSSMIGTKLSSSNSAGGNNDPMDYKDMAFHAMTNDMTIAEAACADLDRFLIMDPAAEGMLKIFLFFKGYHAVQCARIAHYFWLQEQDNNNSQWIASALQSDMSDKFGVDIHPGAKWGKGITMDHGTGCVIGETSVIGDNVYLMHGVTLGATGTSDQQDRHPKVGRGVFIAANATILGNITIGDGAVVGASSLVLNTDVPAGYTAVGIPARLLPPSHTRNSKPKVAPSGVSMPASEYSYDFGSSSDSGDGDGDSSSGDQYNKGGHGMGI